MTQQTASLARLMAALICLVGVLSAQVDGDWELPRWAPGIIQVGPGSKNVGGAGAAVGASNAHVNQGQQPPASATLAVRRVVVEPERSTRRPLAPVDGSAGSFFVVLAGADSAAPGLVLGSGVVGADADPFVRWPAALGTASVLVVVVSPDGVLTVTPWRVAPARGEPTAGPDAEVATPAPAGTTLAK